MGTRDGAWDSDAKIAGGVDDLKNTHPLNCTEDGTLEVNLTGTAIPVDVIVTNVVPVSQSGTWTENQGAPNAGGALAWPVNVTNFPAFPAKQPVDNLTQLVPFEFDYVSITYTGTNATTVIYNQGGAGGTTVATLTITYDMNNNVLTVTRT